MAVNIQLKEFDPKTTLVPADMVYSANSADDYNEVRSTVEGLIGAYPGLLSIGSLTTAANQMIYTTDIDTYAVTPVTTFGRSVLALAAATTTPTINKLAGWDANLNLSANNFLSGFTTTATAAGTTTLTVASSEIQEFTGSTTQTVVMPVASTLVPGHQFTIINNSSGNLTVNSSGGNLIQTMTGASSLYLTCVLASGTSAASWQSSYSADSFPLSIPNGGTGVTSVTIAPTATAFAGWDANSNLSAHNFLEGFATTVTAAGTTTLTVASNRIQEFTGSTTQTVVMPVTSTLALGQGFFIINNSSANVTINSSGGNAILVMAANTTATVVCVLTSGTTAASWNSSYLFDNGAGVLSITGTANQVIASASTGAITLSLPQDIGTTSRPSFANVIEGFTTTATAAGTTTLTVSSTYIQQFTGSTTQTVAMPVASTLAQGQSWQIINNSTGTVTVNSSGGNLIASLAANTGAIVTCVLTSGTTAASWTTSFTSSGSGGAIVTDWVSYTPTFTGFGTVSNVQVKSRRSGNNLYISGRFQGGTTTATEARITLGYNGINANVTSSNTVITSIQLAGFCVFSYSSSPVYTTLIEANVGYITFGIQASGFSGISKINGNDALLANNTMSFTAMIPIASFP